MEKIDLNIKDINIIYQYIFSKNKECKLSDLKSNIESGISVIFINEEGFIKAFIKDFKLKIDDDLSIKQFKDLSIYLEQEYYIY